MIKIDNFNKFNENQSSEIGIGSRVFKIDKEYGRDFRGGYNDVPIISKIVDEDKYIWILDDGEKISKSELGKSKGIYDGWDLLTDEKERQLNSAKNKQTNYKNSKSMIRDINNLLHQNDHKHEVISDIYNRLKDLM